VCSVQGAVMQIRVKSQRVSSRVKSVEWEMKREKRENSGGLVRTERLFIGPLVDGCIMYDNIQGQFSIETRFHATILPHTVPLPPCTLHSTLCSFAYLECFVVASTHHQSATAGLNLHIATSALLPRGRWGGRQLKRKLFLRINRRP
jgi:hypothetical protein